MRFRRWCTFLGVVLPLVLVTGPDMPRGLAPQQVTGTGTMRVSPGQPWVDVVSQGAWIDAQINCSANVTGTSSPYGVTLSSAPFFNASTDSGKELWLPGNAANMQATTYTTVAGTMTVTGTTTATVAVAGSPTVFDGMPACVTWGHDDVNALQASLNLLNQAPFNGVGGEIKIPHGVTGLMMVGQQQATITGGASGLADVSTITLAAGQTFATAVGATVTIQGCSGGAMTSFNGPAVVTDWSPSARTISYIQPHRATTDTCSGGTVTETGVYAPTQTGYIVEAEGKPGTTVFNQSGVRLLGGFSGAFILNIGSVGTTLGAAPTVEGLQFEDSTQTGVVPGGIRCTQCRNGVFREACILELCGRQFARHRRRRQPCSEAVGRLAIRFHIDRRQFPDAGWIERQRQ